MTLSPRIRTVLFWVLLGGFAGISLWWIFSVPYREGEVLRGIPAEAVFVSWHRCPLDREDRLLSNVWVRAAFRRYGADPSALVAAISTGDGAIWKERLARREMATAYVPALRSSGAPAWFFSFWAGGYSQRLRWLLELKGRALTRSISAEPGRAIWVFSNVTALPPGWYLSVAVREGLVLAALSPDPSAVRHALLAAENTPYWSNVRRAGAEAEALRRFRQPAAFDRGWGRLRFPGGREERFWFEADLRADNDWSVEILLHRPAPPPVKVCVRSVKGLIDEAEGSVMVNWTWLYPLIRSGDEEIALWLDRLVIGVTGSREAAFWFGIYGGEQGARIRSLFGSGLSEYIRGLKVPLLVVGMPAADEKRARDTATSVLDLINQNKPWGLVPRSAGVTCGWDVTAVEGTLGGFYRDLAPSEEVAYTVAKEWFWVGSHLGAFENLLPFLSHSDEPEPFQLRPVQIRAKGRRLARSLGQVLSALSLSYAVGGTASAERMRRQIREWRQWLIWLEEVDRLEAEWHATEHGSRLFVRVQTESFPDPETRKSAPP